MAFLAPEPLKLNGGCLCSAIRYTIKVPHLDSRPLWPGALPTPIDKEGQTVETRLPLIDIDHCKSCRRACGGLIQCWFICPQSWVEFKLQPRTGFRQASHAESINSADAVPYACADIANPVPKTIDGTYLGHYLSSPNVHRCFCTRCGTGLTWSTSRDRGPEWKLGDIVDIAVGTLDQESIERVRPDRHGWFDHGTGWIKEMVTGGDQGLIRHSTGRIDQEAKSTAS